jgi:predicted ATPase
MGAAFHEYQGLVFPPAADQRIQMRVRWKSLGRTCSSADLSDGTLRFLYLISILANPNLPSLIAIDEPETGLHPKMMSIVAEYAMDAATRTQLILTTHSPEFLDAFRETQPMVTVADLVDGATQLRTLSGEDLAYWLKEYTLGDIYRSGQLESME